MSASLLVPLGVCFLSQVLFGGSKLMSEWPRTWVVKVNTNGEGEKKKFKKWINWIIHSEYNKINISGYGWVTIWKSSQRKIKDNVCFQMFLEKNVFIWAESLLNWADLFSWLNSLRNESELFPDNQNSKWNKSYH